MDARELRRVLLGIVTGVAIGGGCKGLSSPGSPRFVVSRAFDLKIKSDFACQIISDETYMQCEGPPNARCKTLCGDPTITRCVLDATYEERFAIAARDAGGRAICSSDGELVTLHCEVMEEEGVAKTVVDAPPHRWHTGCPIPGRRLEGLERAMMPENVSAVGRYFAMSAHLEAASVHAFERLARELDANGAPSELGEAAMESARDERRHARMMRRFARFHGAPVPDVVIREPCDRSLEALAIENAIEGVVGETFAAVVAFWQSSHANDASVRDAMRSIAEDESRHAALAFRVSGWARARLPPSGRMRVDTELRAAVADLSRTGAETPSSVRDVVGLPGSAERAGILSALERSLWAGCV